mgnify:CR=1 FL=1
MIDDETASEQQSLAEQARADSPSSPGGENTAAPGAASDPWERFGWMMSVIWLVFLAFPISSALAEPPVPRAVGLAATLVFAVIYVYGFVQFPRRGTKMRVRTLTLVVLAAIGGVLATSIGVEALGLVPFIVAFAIFNQPFPRAVGITIACLVVMAIALTVAGAWRYLWFLCAIVILVAVATGMTRWIEIRQARYSQVENQYRLVAERERVARDVHDVLGHSLTVITVKSELARRLIDVDPAQAAAEIGEIESLSREALGEIRATVAGLRVVRLAEELEHARTALTSARIASDLPDDSAIIDPRYRMVAAWVLREAITNVIRHSGAQMCWVEITADRLVVADDGRGVDGVAGTALRGARERVEASGGVLEIGARAGGGTQVEVCW